MFNQSPAFRSRPARHGFTLTEVLVAVGVLLAIVLVTGRIFKITTDVTAAGEATIDIMQEAAAIEKRIRNDIASMTHTGFLVLHGVGVQNNINIQAWEDGGETGPTPPLLNPTLAADAIIRCDQLVFFREGADTAQGWNDFASSPVLSAYPNARSMHSMIYYGHGIQLPDLGPFIPPDPNNPNSIGWGHDPYDTNDKGDEAKNHRLSPNELTPWRYDNPALEENQWLETTRTDYSSNTQNIFTQSQPSPEDDVHSLYVNATQPDARRWILARQQVLLGDDDREFAGDDSKRQYLKNVPSAKSIFPHDARLSGPEDIGEANWDPALLAYGRVDVAATPLDEVRELLRVSRSSAENDALNACRRCAHDYDEINANLAQNYGIEERNIRESYHNANFFNYSGVYPPIVPPTTYLSQRFFMKDVVTWPRVERTPPSNEKPDQLLAYNMLGSACSSFMVEWTWVEGSGEATVPSPMNRTWDYWPGVHYESGDPLLVLGKGQTNDPPWAFNPWHGQRWFGLRDIERGVMPYEEFVENYPPVEPLEHISPSDPKKPDWNTALDVTAAPFAVNEFAIDREPPVFGGGSSYSEYWATFGLNQESPDLPIEHYVEEWDSVRRIPDPSFTPWPTALRITMTLHDPRGKLEQGHVYQFVVPLPVQALGSHAGGGG